MRRRLLPDRTWSRTSPSELNTAKLKSLLPTPFWLWQPSPWRRVRRNIIISTASGKSPSAKPVGNERVCRAPNKRVRETVRTPFGTLGREPILHSCVGNSIWVPGNTRASSSLLGFALDCLCFWPYRAKLPQRQFPWSSFNRARHGESTKSFVFW